MDVKFSSVGDRINTRLQRLNLKQADLCRETGISTNAISQYVTGKRIPDTTSLYKLSRALNVSMEWILTGNSTSIENNLKHELSCDDIPLNETEMDMISMYRYLDGRDREDVFDYLHLKYDKATGEKRSIYSTYSGTNEPQDGGAQDINNSGSGIA